MEVLFYLVIWVVFGLICMKMAETRGRDKIIGFIVGLLLGIVGVIIYWIIGDTQEMKDTKFSQQIKRVDSVRGKK